MRRLAIQAFVAGLALVAGGCAKNQTLRPATVQAIDNDAQIGDAVSRLERGDIKAARKLLRAMARRDPADRRVTDMRQSIDLDPVKTLGTTSFSYRVQPGDRMISLSQRFLANRYKFHLLARYNGLKAAEPLRVGAYLKIPGVEPKPPAIPQPERVRPEPAPRPADPAVDRSEPPPSRPAVEPARPPINARRAVQLRGAGLGALARGDPRRAVTLLNAAATADPQNLAIARDLARARRLAATVRSR